MKFFKKFKKLRGLFNLNKIKFDKILYINLCIVYSTFSYILYIILLCIPQDIEFMQNLYFLPVKCLVTKKLKSSPITHTRTVYIHVYIKLQHRSGQVDSK